MGSKKVQRNVDSPKDQLSGIARSTQQQNEQEDPRDLDVPDERAAGIVGGLELENAMISGYVVKPPAGNGGGTAGAGWDVRAPKGA
jgi:hypothetical protein